MGFFTNIASSFIKQRVVNTKTALELIVDDFKRYFLIFKWFFLLISASTLIYGIIAKTGNPIINYILLCLLVVYALLDTVLRIKQKPKHTKQLRRIYTWLKLFINGVALTSSLYGLYCATTYDGIEPIQIILATLSLLAFVLKVFFEISLEIFSSKWLLLKNAMLMDAKEHPKTSGKIFSPIIGDHEEKEVKNSIFNRINDRKNKNK